MRKIAWRNHQRPHSRSWLQLCSSLHIHTHTHADTEFIYSNHTYTHTYTHTHTHTHTHAQIHTLSGVIISKFQSAQLHSLSPSLSLVCACVCVCVRACVIVAMGPPVSYGTMAACAAAAAVALGGERVQTASQAADPLPSALVSVFSHTHIHTNTHTRTHAHNICTLFLTLPSLCRPLSLSDLRLGRALTLTPLRSFCDHSDVRRARAVHSRRGAQAAQALPCCSHHR